MRKVWATALAAALIGGGIAAVTTGQVDAAARTKVGQQRKVARVIDGDTIKFGNGETVRLIGIDTPERGQCGHVKATRNMTRLVEGKRVTVISKKGVDAYGRSLYGVKVRNAAGNWVNPQASQIKKGLADARYDGRDGYGWHKHQRLYRRLDATHPDITCDNSGGGGGAAGQPWNQPVSASNPDLDCADIGRRVRVLPPDYHRLDADGDGWGCESWG